MSNYTDKAIKLVTRLGQIDEKIFTLQAERTNVMAEIASTLGDNTTTTKTNIKTKANTGNLGDKIVVFLQTNGGKDLAQIVQAMKVEPKKVGLSLYHLTKKGQAFTDKGIYYASAAILQAAAKTSPEDEGN